MPQADTSAIGQHQPLTRDEARRRLLAAGALSIHRAPEGTVMLSEDELIQLGQLAPGSRTSEALVDEERGQY